MVSRITPLNITSAVLVVILGYSIFGGNVSVSGISVWLVAGILLLCVVSDILFRGMLRNLKKIWLTELLFMSLVIALILIIKRI